MGRKYTKEAIDAIHTYLNSNLNTVLGTVRTAWSSSTVPANCAKLAKRADPTPVFPKVVIQKSTTERNYGDEAAPLIDPFLYHNVIIQITHKCANLQELDETLMGYEEAIERLQEASDTFGGAFIWVRVGTTEWLPVYENQENKVVMQSIQIPLQCRSI